MLPFADLLVQQCWEAGHEAALYRDHDSLVQADITFFVGCVRVAKPHTLAKAKFNLVVHASDLPKGRGFSPLTWQIIEGHNDIPVCLLHASHTVDAGNVIYRDWLHFEGHELIDEMRNQLGTKSNELCLRFVNEPTPPLGAPQVGEPTVYRRRTRADSELDPSRPLVEQFSLLRTVDNERYPAFFNLHGRRYRIRIDKNH